MATVGAAVAIKELPYWIALPFWIETTTAIAILSVFTVVALVTISDWRTQWASSKD